jgi:hypothetical protein
MPTQKDNVTSWDAARITLVTNAALALLIIVGWAVWDGIYSAGKKAGQSSGFQTLEI